MTDIREIARRFNLRAQAGAFIGTCPACGYKDSLRITSQNGRALWWCGACQDQAAVTAAISGQAAQAAPMAAAADASQVQKREWALALWADALPAAGTVVERYLTARGITLRDDMPLRFLPNHLDRDGGKRWPVMVALMVDCAGTPQAIHRTFIAQDGKGKAPIATPRKTLGIVAGAAVRLAPIADRLVIGEGIETSISAGLMMGAPAWAAISAPNLEFKLKLPASIKEIVVAADHDGPGLKAARAALARWKAEGRAVKIARPQTPGADFNDLWRARGGAAP
ncbi:MAG: toprim domain-containing protein [Roseomonas sp.]|nr:toprim domain-containing protein [Roseomonas sp.]MCA3430494.1 toprim domain-containing protein [Roseomonas sp.]MCA3433897.1 toprim domain-containing protein [Roseomonas sp.]